MKQLGWVMVVVAACGGHPEIKKWDATPKAYCPSTKAIHVVWKGKHGTTRLELTEPGQQPVVKSTDSKGTLELPPKPMQLRFIVEKDGKAPAITTADVDSAFKLKPLGLNGTKCDANGWMEMKPQAYGGSDPDAFAPNIRLGSISNACPDGADAAHSCKRSVKLVHEGKTWTLAPGASQDVGSANVVVGGEWGASQSLLPGEACGTTSADPALNLSVKISAICVEKR